MFPLTITLIQSNIFWEDKKANLKMFEQKIEAIEEKTEIVILPEMFNTGFSMKPEILAETMDGETVRWMKRVSSEKKVIVTGSVMIEDSAPNQQQKKYFNRLIWMLPNGEMGIYDKRHLFAFAAENEHYSAGNKKLIASVKGWKINLQICYDLRFPVWTRQEPHAPENQYDVLINVANWPEKRNLAWQTLLRARAIENQCYAIGVNRIGEDGFGFVFAMKTLDGGRIGIASQALGIASGAYELSKAYSKTRKAFGTEIMNHQAIAFKLADMATRINAARLLCLKAAWEKDNGIEYGVSSSMAKVYASETAMWTAVEAVQIHGGYGFVKEYHVERMMRDAKITQIYEGTSEVQRIVISRSILK